MAHGFGPQQKGSVNVELNIVPFIDLMSCLTAFLLVTAVWINLAHLRNEPAGRGREHDSEIDHPRLSILLESDQIVVTQQPSGDARQLAANDWTRLETALRDFQSPGEVPHVEIAAASSDQHPVSYQSLIAAMDTAVKAGFPDVGVTDPASLGR